MSWHPNDLVTDADLTSYERTILTQFNVQEWQNRRQKALEDWLFPLLEGQGFPPQRLRTRYVPTAVQSKTGGVFTDRTAAAATEDGLNLATILATPTTDALYVGYANQFRGLSIRVHDSPNATASILSMALWTDKWTAPTSVANGTDVQGKAFAQGGAITWVLPETLVVRTVNSLGPAYWARLQLSAVPTGTLIGPVLVIRRSRLCAAVTFRTLALIFREAPISQEGPWREKAEWYEQEAERAWNRVKGLIGGEFDLDGDDAIDDDEAGQTAEEVAGVWTQDRY